MGHLVAGEAPLFLGGTPSTFILNALGIPSRPTLPLVSKHFDRVIALAADPNLGGHRPDELKTTFDEIYRFLGQTAGPRATSTRPATPLKATYENRPCIWDSPRQRLVKPRDVFAEHVQFFEPYKIRVDAEATIAAGLDTLGRRVSPETADYVDFLRLLAASKDGGICSEREHAQALNALEQVGKANGTNVIDDDTPVLTQTDRVLPIEEVFKMDVPFWSKRFADTQVEFIYPHVMAPRILKAVRRISEAAQEVLEAEPLPSRDRGIGIEALCFHLQALIRSREFSRALIRLASHECGYSLDSYNPNFADFQVCPAVEIRTVLELEREGEILRMGSHDVDFFVDGGSEKVWIATRSIKGVQHKLAKATPKNS